MVSMQSPTPSSLLSDPAQQFPRASTSSDDTLTPIQVAQALQAESRELRDRCQAACLGLRVEYLLRRAGGG